MQTGDTTAKKIEKKKGASHFHLARIQSLNEAPQCGVNRRGSTYAQATQPGL